METVGGDLPKAWANAEAITKGEKAQITGIPESSNRVAVLASATRSGILTCNVQKKKRYRGQDSQVHDGRLDAESKIGPSVWTLVSSTQSEMMATFHRLQHHFIQGLSEDDTLAR